MRQTLVMAAVGLAAVSLSAETALWNYVAGSAEAGPWPIYAATQTAPPAQTGMRKRTKGPGSSRAVTRSGLPAGAARCLLPGEIRGVGFLL